MKGYIFFISILLSFLVGIYKNDAEQATLSLLLLPISIHYIILSKEKEK